MMFVMRHHHSLARFTAYPRQGHLKQAKQVFGYLKKPPNRRIVVNSRDPTFLNCETGFEMDYVKEQQEGYPDACEEVDVNVPERLIDKLAITVFVDSDHAHDKVTRRSVTEMMIFVGRTPIFFSSK